MPIGLSPGFTMLHDSLEELRRDLDAMVDLGVERLRIDLSWASLQPEPDRFDWSSTDRVLREATARGIDVLAVVGFQPSWAERADAADQALPPDSAAFSTFVRAAAERYRDEVDAWEIWNEPNTRRFWGAEPDPADYAALVAAVSPVIRAAEPGAAVVVGAMSPAQDGPGEVSPEGFLTGLYDQLDPNLFDAVSVHPYTYPALPTQTQDYNTFFQLEALHQVMAAAADAGTPIWLTEFGAPTGTSDTAVSDDEQAVQISSGIEEARSRSYLGPLYVYSLRDAGTDPANPEDDFGILRADGSPKPAYAAVGELVPAARCSWTDTRRGEESLAS